MQLPCDVGCNTVVCTRRHPTTACKAEHACSCSYTATSCAPRLGFMFVVVWYERILRMHTQVHLPAIKPPKAAAFALDLLTQYFSAGQLLNVWHTCAQGHVLASCAIGTRCTLSVLSVAYVNLLRLMLCCLLIAHGWNACRIHASSWQ
jgi:hypothetical protein